MKENIEANGGGEAGLVSILRKIAERQIKTGVLRGYLTFDNGVSIGWCNANDRANLPGESGNG